MVEKRDFTDRYLKSIKAAEPGKRVVIYDAQVPGFGIRISEKANDDDKGSFVLITRFPGGNNPTTRRIGDYPAMTLAKARAIAREWREDIRQGVDPRTKEAERLRLEAREKASTFGSTFEAFAEDHLSTIRTGDVVKKAVEKHVYPAFEDRPIAAIKRADINELIRGLKRTAPIGANRLLAYLKKFFSWCVDQDLIEVSPAAAVKKPSKENTRDRALSETEVQAIWHAAGQAGIFGKAVKLMLVTGQRRGEVCGMTWDEIDPKTKAWSLSRERTKANRAHEVPLTGLAMEIIESCPKLGKFVFTTGRSAVGRAGTNDPVSISGWGKAKEQIDQIALAKLKEHDPEAKLAEWHLHDLRRTCATFLAKIGTDRIVISKILNHAEGGVTGIYDRHRYDVEKRDALARWSDRLIEIVKGREPTNVVPLALGRR